MSGKTMEPTNKSSANKIKELLSACRSSFKKRNGCRRYLGVSDKLCGVENFDLTQKISGKSVSVLGSDTSACVGSTDSFTKDLCALSQSSADNIHERKQPCGEEVSGYTSTSSEPKLELSKSEKKSSVEQFEILSKSPVNKPNLKECVVSSKASEEKLEVKQLDGYVGFANLPNQIYWRAVKKGFEFTLMVVGQSGLGKSTLINSMFLTDIYNSTNNLGPTRRYKGTVSVEATRVTLKESGVNLALTVIDTPGFGDAINNVNSWTPIVEFIESKYKTHLNSENQINRKVISDERVHCCLYFIQPTGHGLKSLDVEFMKRLHDKVNIVPVIAKADTLTEEECCIFKQQIMAEISEHNIKIYEFPDVSEEDEDYLLNKSLRDRVPFAVVGSNTVIEINGKKVRGRKYPWGVVDIENMEQCDFIALRKMVVCTHMQDLKDVTHFVHYENYRHRKLMVDTGMNGKYLISDTFVVMDKERREHKLKLQKMECEMQELYEETVRKKTQNFENRQADLKERFENSQKQYKQHAKNIEEKFKQFVLETQTSKSGKQQIVNIDKSQNLDGYQEFVENNQEKKM